MNYVKSFQHKLRLIRTLSLFFFFTIAHWACESVIGAKLGFGETRMFASRTEVDLLYQSKDGIVLSGTLYLPPGDGPFPAIVAHYGSDRWTRSPYSGFVRLFTDKGIAILSYDKRGVGKSGGECCPFRDEGYFNLLAEDVLAGVRMISKHPSINFAQVGLWGFSQGGWVIPVVAASVPEEIAFTIIGSGPAVTLGETLAYSDITGGARCENSGLTKQEIEQRFSQVSPYLFDPTPYLEQMQCPGLWMYAKDDALVPVERSLNTLNRIKQDGAKDWTIEVFEGVNHVFIPNAGPCVSGLPATTLSEQAVYDFLLTRLNLE